MILQGEDVKGRLVILEINKVAEIDDMNINLILRLVLIKI